MKRSVRVLRRAQQDLAQLDDFLQREAPSRADRYVDGLFDALESLATMAERGALPRDAILRAAGYRYLVYRTHLIFYKVLGRQVRVYRVVHGHRAYREIL